MHRACLLLLLVSIAWVPSRTLAEELALQGGEALTYRVAWGIFPHAGEIAISAREETEAGVPYMVVSSRTSTRGVVRRLFRFDAEAEAIFDRRTGRLMLYRESSSSRKKRTHSALDFDYEKGVATFTDFVNPDRSTTVSLPGECAADLIMSLIETRHWNLDPGQKRDTDVIFGKDIYELTVHALRRESVRTALGNFETVVLEPRMEKTPPKGMFRRGSQVHVWIAQNDPRRLPVMFEVEFNFGTGVATLEEYVPPGSTPPEAVARVSDPEDSRSE